MGNYNSQYESYYSNLQPNHGKSTYGANKSKGYNKYINRFIQEITGVFLLSFAIFFCKMVKLPQTTMIYDYAKKTVNYNIDYKATWVKINKIDYKDMNNYAKMLTKKINKVLKEDMKFQKDTI